MKIQSVLFVLVFGLVANSMHGQYLSSHIEHYSYETTIHNIKFVLSVAENTTAPDSLWYNTGDGSPPKKIHKTNSIELKNNVRSLEYSFSHAFPGTAGVAFNFLIDSSYFYISQNHFPVDSGYFSHVFLVDLFFVEGQSSVLFNDYLVKQIAPGEQLIMNPVADINILPDYQLSPFDEPGLHFELGEMIDTAQYHLPDGISIHPQTGEIRWEVPENAPLGQYELFIYVGKQLTYGGESLKRLVFYVADTIPEGMLYNGLDDWETDAAGYYEYHIPANENFQLQFSMEHNATDSLNLFSHSEVYLFQNGASFSNSIGNGSLTTDFNWTPNESHIRSTPYVVHFVPTYSYNGYCYYDFITVSIFVNQSVGMLESVSTNLLDIFPNPTTSYLTLTSPSLLPGTHITVYNLAGQQVYGQELSQNTPELVLDARHFGPAGMYLLHVQPPGMAAVLKKVVVQE